VRRRSAGECEQDEPLDLALQLSLSLSAAVAVRSVCPCSAVQVSHHVYDCERLHVKERGARLLAPPALLPSAPAVRALSSSALATAALRSSSSTACSFLRCSIDGRRRRRRRRCGRGRALALLLDEGPCGRLAHRRRDGRRRALDLVGALAERWCVDGRGGSWCRCRCRWGCSCGCWSGRRCARGERRGREGARAVLALDLLGPKLCRTTRVRR